MTWLFLCLCTALFAGTSDALIKEALKTHRPAAAALLRYAWPTIFLIPFVFTQPLPSDPRTFWTMIALAMPLEVAAALMSQNALHRSPLSLTVPYLAFTPVFLLLTGWIVLGEIPTAGGILGVATVTAGALILQRRPEHRHWIFTVIPADQGSRLMLGVAFLYSITCALTKKAALAGSAIAFPGIYFGLLSLCLIPTQGRSGWFRELARRPGLFATIGLLEATTLLLQFQAFMHVEVAYVISIKRLSPLLSIALGRLIFHEEASPVRVGGAVLMVAGAAVIAIFG